MPRYTRLPLKPDAPGTLWHPLPVTSAPFNHLPRPSAQAPYPTPTEPFHNLPPCQVPFPLLVLCFLHSPTSPLPTGQDLLVLQGLSLPAPVACILHQVLRSEFLLYSHRPLCGPHQSSCGPVQGSLLVCLPIQTGSFLSLEPGSIHLSILGLTTVTQSDIKITECMNKK